MSTVDLKKWYEQKTQLSVVNSFLMKVAIAALAPQVGESRQQWRSVPSGLPSKTLPQNYHMNVNKSDMQTWWTWTCYMHIITITGFLGIEIIITPNCSLRSFSQTLWCLPWHWLCIPVTPAVCVHIRTSVPPGRWHWYHHTPVGWKASTWKKGRKQIHLLQKTTCCIWVSEHSCV